MKIYNLIRVVAVVTLYLSLSNPSYSQQELLGVFDGQTDVGNPGKSGAATYDAEKQQYTIEGAGTNMWLGRDEFHFAWQRLKGNFILTTRAEFIGKGVEEHRKIGWTVRSSLEPDSPHVTAVVHGDGLTSLQFRRTKGAITEQAISPLKAADVIQLERKGNVFVMSVARFKDPFVTAQIADVALGDEVCRCTNRATLHWRGDQLPRWPSFWSCPGGGDSETDTELESVGELARVSAG